MHTPLQLTTITLTIGGKTLLTNATASVHTGDRIALIGANGTGKTSLLRMLHGDIQPSAGTLAIPKDLRIAYVAQHQAAHGASGGEQTIAAIYQALAQDPDILLLDEPTNHLDAARKQQVLSLLQKQTCTIIVVTHDEYLLNNWSYNTVWHLDQQKLTVLNTNYQAFLREKETHHTHLLEQKRQLKKELGKTRKAQQKEHHRAAQSKKKGQKKYAGDTLARSTKKRQAEHTTSNVQARLHDKQQALWQKLQTCTLPESIKPQFSVDSVQHVNNRIEIRDGSVAYGNKPVLQNINLIVDAGERVAFVGANGSGKSTLLKAIIGDTSIRRTGEWVCPLPSSIGYFDQHYATVLQYATPFEAIQSLLPHATHNEIRIILNRFLFRTNQDVYTPTGQLSGGERVRLTLAILATQTPATLLLDEVTNNLDTQTRAHVRDVLQGYPGTLIVVSHDADFITKLDIDRTIEIAPYTNSKS